MTLLTAHKILITAATLFFALFALWELRNYANGGELWAAARSGLYFFVAFGFGAYFKNLHRWYNLK